MHNKAQLKNITTFAFSDRTSLLDYIIDKKQILIAINAEKILNAEEKLQDIINNNIGYPDGIGAVLALRQKGLDAIKIPGTELWLDIIKRYSKEKKVYLIGSTSEVISKTASKLNEDYPDLQICGYRNGFLNNDTKNLLIQELKEKKPDIVFVAQGSPKQEYLMRDLLDEWPALYMGLGGSFDIYSGLKQRAPFVFRNYGFEWLYRLLKEPTRIRRQVVLVKFIILLALRKI